MPTRDRDLATLDEVLYGRPKTPISLVSKNMPNLLSEQNMNLNSIDTKVTIYSGPYQDVSLAAKRISLETRRRFEEKETKLETFQRNLDHNIRKLQEKKEFKCLEEGKHEKKIKEYDTTRGRRRKRQYGQNRSGCTESGQQQLIQVIEYSNETENDDICTNHAVNENNSNDNGNIMHDKEPPEHKHESDIKEHETTKTNTQSETTGNENIPQNLIVYGNIGKGKTIDGKNGVPANDCLDHHFEEHDIVATNTDNNCNNINKTTATTNISTHKIESLLDISLTDLNDEIINNEGDHFQQGIPNNGEQYINDQEGHKVAKASHNPEDSSTGMGSNRSFLEQEMARNIALEEEAKQMLTDSSSYLFNKNNI